MRNPLAKIKHVPNKNAALAVIGASILVLVGIGSVSLSYAGEDTQGKVISGPSAAKLTVSCDVTVNPGDCIEVKYYDRDNNGVNDLLVYNRQVISQYTGVINGTVIMLQTNARDLNTKIEKGTATSVFTGTIGDSKPGTMTLIQTFVLDSSNATSRKWAGNAVVVEGSGMGGLAGICGSGSYEGSAPPPASTSWYEFRFGDACNSAKP